MKVDGHGHLGCIQNATAGEEHRRGWHPERFDRAANADRAVLVVGAGPAGMEAAITLGKRGFEAVHLVEAEPEVGGRLRWVRRLPTLGDWGRIVDYRQIQLDKLPNVAVVTKRRLDAAAVHDYGAQIVIVATGSRWSGDGMQASTHEPIEGADAALPHVLTPEQVAGGGKRPPGRRVAVYDAEGYWCGPAIAELLALEGFETHLVTTFDVVSPISDLTLEGGLLRQHLHEVGVLVHRGVTIERVDADGIAGVNEFGEPFSLGVDGVVLVDAAGLGRRALPRPGRRPGGARSGGHRGRVPHRRLRFAAHDLRGDLRRPPAGSRDRLGRPGARAAVRPRARRPRRGPGRSPVTRDALRGAAPQQWTGRKRDLVRGGQDAPRPRTRHSAAS